MERTGADIRWSVVSLVADGRDEADGAASRGRDDKATATDLSGAKAALDRVVIPQETVDRIAEIVSPRSSLIISDESLSSETGEGTDFVVLMSGEPKGGLTHRRRERQIEVRYDRLPYWRSPFGAPYSPWWH
jgi:hypothetical protein